MKVGGVKEQLLIPDLSLLRELRLLNGLLVAGFSQTAEVVPFEGFSLRRGPASSSGAGERARDGQGGSWGGQLGAGPLSGGFAVPQLPCQVMKVSLDGWVQAQRNRRPHATGLQFSWQSWPTQDFAAASSSLQLAAGSS